jgi:two-component system sensor histidine kinase YesM
MRLNPLRWIGTSITYKLTAAFMLLIITPVLIIGYLSFRFSEEIILKKVGASTSKTLEQTAGNVDNLLNGMISVSNSLNLNQNIVRILAGAKGDLRQEWQNASLIDNLFMTIHSSFFPYNSYFTLISARGRPYTSWDTLRDSTSKLMSESWYRRIPDNRFIWITAQKNYVHEERVRYPEVFTLAGSIQRDMGRKVFGKFIISLPHQEIINILTKAAAFPESNLALLDEGNRPFIQTRAMEGRSFWNKVAGSATGNPGGSFISVAAGRKYLINYQRLNKNGWKVAEIIPYESLLGEIRELRAKITVLLCLFIAVFVMIAAFIAVSITRPIKQLSGSIRRVEDGDLTVRVAVTGWDEVGRLMASFNKMVGKIGDLIDQLYQEQRRERELELEALQAQIKPHFLFNTLNSIRWVAVMNQAESVADMIGALSNLLKMSINSAKFISFEAELESLKSYIFIQQVRYNSRFETVFDFEPAVLKLPTIKLILQPVVENAILHGLAKTAEGRIDVSGRIDGESVLVTVADNGRGMSAARLAEVNRTLDAPAETQGRGIGLINVYQRLRLNFGDRAGLTIVSAPDRGTVVTLKLPLLPERMDEQ